VVRDLAGIGVKRCSEGVFCFDFVVSLFTNLSIYHVTLKKEQLSENIKNFMIFFIFFFYILIFSNPGIYRSCYDVSYNRLQ